MGITDSFNVATTGMRHMVAPSTDFGLSSWRYNAQDKYQNEYSDAQRTAAGMGAGYGVALPGLAAITAVKSFGAGKMPLAGKIGTGLWVGGATVAAGFQASKLIGSDGNYGSVGTAGGAVLGVAGGLLAGKLMGAGKFTPLISGALGAAGGVGGHFAGKAIETGDSKIGERNPAPSFPDVPVLKEGLEFATGATNHFVEVGPATQGLSIGGAWGLNQTVAEDSSPREQSGAMHGDLAAAAILGGGALAVLGAATGAKGFVPKGMEKGSQAAADVAMSAAKFSPIKATMMAAGSSSGKAAGIAAAGVGIAALTAGELMEFSKDHGDAAFVGPTVAGATLVATAGTAVGLSKTTWMKNLSGGKPMAALANGTLAAAALVGAASSAQMPIRQFVSDAKAAHASNEDPNWVTATGATVIGAGAGGYGAGKWLSNDNIIPADGIRFKLPFGKGTEIHLPKYGGKFKPLGIVGVGAALGAAALGATGFGLSATMPSPVLAAASTGIGAGLGALAGAKLRGATAKAGLIAGAGIGLSASTLMPGAHGDKAPKPELAR